MWQPEFLHVESTQAHLYGWHRAMCILSHFYRGTVECPGLVLGLDRGGSCTGVAFRILHSDWPTVQDSLHAREMINGVYTPRFQMVRLLDGRKVQAYVFVADRTHTQYWRGALDQAAKLVVQGVGSRGSSKEYLQKTVAELQMLGIQDQGLLRLQAKVSLMDSAP